MKEKPDNQSFLKTNVYSEYGEFFVSTIYRRSSAMLAPDMWYYETFGWKTDAEGERHIIADNSGAPHVRGAIEQHMEVINQLMEKGKFEQIEEQEPPKNTK